MQRYGAKALKVSFEGISKNIGLIISDASSLVRLKRYPYIRKQEKEVRGGRQREVRRDMRMYLLG